MFDVRRVWSSVPQGGVQSSLQKCIKGKSQRTSNCEIMMKAICVLYMYLYFLIMTTPSTIIIGGGGKVQLKNILRKISRGYDARPLSTGHNGAPNECQIMCTNINVKMFRLKSATKLVIFLIHKYIQYIVQLHFMICLKLCVPLWLTFLSSEIYR